MLVGEIPMGRGPAYNREWEVADRVVLLLIRVQQNTWGGKGPDR